MDLTNDRDLMEQIRVALLKPSASRSYDDLLLLKSYISKTELVTKDLAGIVSPREMNDICRSLGMESYTAGQVVFNQGDSGDKVYIVLEGKCDVRVRYKIDLTQGQSEIREKFIVTYTSGQFFGERALKFDEPRSATVTCTELTHLVTIHKSVYLAALTDARKEGANMKSEQFGTKEGVIKILSKVREKRTAKELDAVAAYLYRRIPFFQKFTMQQLIELCRVAETVTIWGRSILFKEGQIGQAFYVILTGTVEVWVQDNKDPHKITPSKLNNNNNTSSSSLNNKKTFDITEGLGSKVNQLVTGDVFGERALENDSSQRMASIVTGEDSTDLLVISKEDYHNLVYVMMHDDSMHKLQLLRRTSLFHNLDVVHLRALARFMETKKYQINDELVSAGKRATEIIIVEKGECRVITEITEGFEQPSQQSKANSPHFMLDTQQSHHSTPSHNHPPQGGEGEGDKGGGGGAAVDAVHDEWTRRRSSTSSAAALLTPSQLRHAVVPDENENDDEFGEYGEGESVKRTKAFSIEHNHRLRRNGRRKHPAPSLQHPSSSSSTPLASSPTPGSSAVLEISRKTSQIGPTSPLKRTPSLSLSSPFRSRTQSEADEDESGETRDRFDSDAVRLTAGPAASLTDNNTTPSHKSHNKPHVLRRLESHRLVPIGRRRKKVDLGRIAPDSVLSPYMVLADGAHSGDVFHPETVVAATLVSAYVISKQDFFNHVPKDSKAALQRLVREYKAPVLNPLWENTPRVLSESEWRMDKAWARFKQDFSSHPGKSSDILQSLRAVSRLHLSLSSGNDPIGRTASARGLSGAGGDGKGLEDKGGAALVTMDWGLPAGLTAREREKEKERERESARRTPLPSARRPDSAEKTREKKENKRDKKDKENPAFLSREKSFSAEQGDGFSTATNPIRQRINAAHARELSLRDASNTGSLDPLGAALALRASQPALTTTASSASLSLTHNTQEDGTPQSALSRHTRLVEQPFSLVQIHREYQRPSANAVSSQRPQGRRALRSYMRLCGTFPSLAKAKELADKHMEHVYLTLFQSRTEREDELLLRWETFKGFESLSAEHSEHFLVYCRSTPMESASLSPSKSLFHASFPAMCRLPGQRFAVAVVNPILAEDSLWATCASNNNNGKTRGRKGKKCTVAGPSRVRGKGVGRTLSAVGEREEERDGEGEGEREGVELDGEGEDEVFDAFNPESDPDEDEGVEESLSLSLSQKSGSSPQANRANVRSSFVSANGSQSAKSSRLQNNNNSNANNALLRKSLSLSQDGAVSTKTSSTPSRANPLAQPPLSLSLSHEQSGASLSLPPFVNTKKSSWPLSLQELSSLYEVLVVGATRIETLRYAIRRFGALPQDVLALSAALLYADTHTGTDFLLSTPSLSTPSFSTPSSSTPSFSNPSSSTPFPSSSTLQLKPISESNKLDRILRIVHQEQKRVCVVPLYRWVLVGEETMQTLDFLSAFKESAIRNILLAEEFDQNPHRDELDIDVDPIFDSRREGVEEGVDGDGVDGEGVEEGVGGAERPVIATGEYRDLGSALEQRRLPAELVKSFSEAGFIPRAVERQTLHNSASLPALHHTKHSHNSTYTPHNTHSTHSESGSEEPVSSLADQARALKILEREVESKEMSKQIRALSLQQTQQTLRTNTLANTLANTVSTSNKFSHNSSSPAAPLSPTVTGAATATATATGATTAEDLQSVSSTRSKGKTSARDSGVEVELRLKSLARAVNAATRILDTHDQLCDIEHGAGSVSGSLSLSVSVSPPRSPQRVVPKEERLKLRRENKSGVMKERLHVIESLQKMKFSATSTANNSINSNNAKPPTAVSEKAAQDSGLSAQATVRAMLGVGKSGGKGFTPNTVAGRRLAENLRVLSDTLDAQLQQKLN